MMDIPGELSYMICFVGEGLYENGGEGSPLVALRQVKDVHFANVARSVNLPKIDCHFKRYNT